MFPLILEGLQSLATAGVFSKVLLESGCGLQGLYTIWLVCAHAGACAHVCEHV